MIAYFKSCLAGFVSAEVKASQNRYNKKCTECRLLIDRAAKADRESFDSRDKAERLVREVATLEVKCEQYELVVEARDNQIMLTDQVVAQQQSMIHRDIDLRRLEHITASSQVEMARTHTGIKEDSNANNESDVNYRPGR